MNAQAKLAIFAPSEDKGLVDHDFGPLGVGQIDVSHGDGNVAMDLNPVLCGVVVISRFHPVLQGKASVFRVLLASSDEVREGTFLCAAKCVLAERQSRFEEDLPLFVVV